MKVSVISVFIVACLLGAVDARAQSNSWKRTHMEQGYYAAIVSNSAGAQFRADCGPSEDGGSGYSVGYIRAERPDESDG